MNRAWLITALSASALVAAAVAVPDSGLYERVGIPVAPEALRGLLAANRTVAQLSAALTAGVLLYAVVFAPHQRSGVLDVDGYRAVRLARWTAAVGAVAALGQAVLVAADLTGSAVTDVLGVAGLIGEYAALEEPVGWLVTAAALLVVAAGCCATVRWRPVAALAVLAALAMTAPNAASWSIAGADHDWGTDASVVRTVAAVVWTGTLLVPLVLRPYAPRRRAVLLALCGAAWVAGTVVFWFVQTGGTPALDTPWGLLLAAQLVVACAVAACWRSPRLALAGSLLVTALSAAQANAVPPRMYGPPDTIGQALIGFDVAGPATAARLLLDWRPNLVFCTIAGIAVGLYLHGVRVLRRRGDAWPVGRTTVWVLGWLIVLLATSSGLGRYGSAQFSVHMIGHMMIGMLAPVLLALGGAVTLALRALAPSRQGSGPREWIVAALASPLARFATHPVPAMIVFVGSFYVLYFTPIFDTTLRYHWAHQLMFVHILAVGYVFFWPLIGVDRAPVRLPSIGRLAVLLASMPFHAFFGVALMSADSVLGSDFYRSIALPGLHLLTDQRIGGGIAWATGELPMLVVVIVLLVQWSREDARDAARHDRKADRDGDADLTAYNAMLADLARTRA
ncbi:cytochrome c oxidase assembly protein [Pseudonocardia sp. TRM90224]|uniref:cytochrome c oxidase assembly protein n=1 Tax=Pseudonocardia sp. TRM90224 TaxID=2812678 RepID=UPI001E5628B2|nr:cytochrome c oxidase assembly protein [Pseudonocardia sp. TRM90224]